MTTLEHIAWARRQAVDADLTPTEAHVLLALASYADADGRAYPSVATVGANVRRKRTVVLAAIKALREKSVITSRQRGPGRPPLYVLGSGPPDGKGSGQPDGKEPSGPAHRTARGPASRTKGSGKPDPEGPEKDQGTTAPPQPPKGGKHRERIKFEHDCATWVAQLIPELDGHPNAAKIGRQAIAVSRAPRSEAATIDPTTPEGLREFLRYSWPAVHDVIGERVSA